MNHVALVKHAQPPYTTLEKLLPDAGTPFATLKAGNRMAACFVTQRESFGNDFLPATVEKIDGRRVSLRWDNGFTSTIDARHVAVRSLTAADVVEGGDEALGFVQEIPDMSSALLIVGALLGLILAVVVSKLIVVVLGLIFSYFLTSIVIVKETYGNRLTYVRLTLAFTIYAVVIAIILSLKA
jgi:hypothetical protein